MIAVTSKSFSKNDLLVESLKKRFPDQEVRLQLGAKGLNETELIQFLEGCDRAIIALEEINEAVLRQLPQLIKISKFGVGLNNIDKAACEKYGVKVGWTGGVNKLSVAEMTLGFMLGLSRNLYQSSYNLKEGNWIKNGGTQLSEKTIGIIGVGHIGKELIRLLGPFNCKILVNDIIEQKKYYESVNVSDVSKEQIYKDADIITIHTPLTDRTYNLFCKTVFENLQKKPFLINTARGGIVNELELVDAIDRELISGAAIDVFVSEPLDIEKLYKNKKIVTTPHIGGNAKEAIWNMGISAINNLVI